MRQASSRPGNWSGRGVCALSGVSTFDFVNLSSIDLTFSVRHTNRDDQDFAEFAERIRTTRFLDGSRMPVNVCLGLTLPAPARPFRRPRTRGPRLEEISSPSLLRRRVTA